MGDEVEEEEEEDRGRQGLKGGGRYCACVRAYTLSLRTAHALWLSPHLSREGVVKGLCYSCKRVTGWADASA